MESIVEVPGADGRVVRHPDIVQVGTPSLNLSINAIDDMRSGVPSGQQGGDHNMSVWKFPAGLLRHLTHCLSSVPMEAAQVVGSCMDNQVLRAPKSLFPQQLHPVACIGAAFVLCFQARKKLPGVQVLPVGVSQQERLWGLFSTLCRRRLGWAGLSVGSRLQRCIRKCQGATGLDCE